MHHDTINPSDVSDIIISFHFVLEKRQYDRQFNPHAKVSEANRTRCYPPRLSATEAGRFTSRRSEPMKPSRRRERKQKSGHSLCSTRPLLKATTAMNSPRIEMVRSGSNFLLCSPLSRSLSPSERTRAPPSTYAHAQDKVFIVYKYVTCALLHKLMNTSRIRGTLDGFNGFVLVFFCSISTVLNVAFVLILDIFDLNNLRIIQRTYIHISLARRLYQCGIMTIPLFITQNCDTSD